MRVKEVMTAGVECVGPDSTLQEAADRMKALDVGVLPVCENDRLAGMLTDRDIAVRSAAAGHDPTQERVRDVMTPKVVYCIEDQLVSEAAGLMQMHQIRRLPVLNHNKRLVGIVSLGDLAVDAHDEELVGSTLEVVSEPARPRR